ncbi:MAG TPA: 50S ribosomal protein L14 [Candidatus Aenigmarchaeota archaeon]|nr:MAG: 50S ribosomal protein L14 [Candidatus Aenigmarchaeota archaeon]HDI06634.1 50S ribosomal protein L14 [Candidatus Aenigmarchaeota archaeon]
MKAISGKVVKALNSGSILNCADNSGAKKVQIISFKTYKGRKRRYPSGGVGDVVTCVVKKGDFKLRHKLQYGVIIRQKKEYRRSNGMRICFEDNALILVDKKITPLGSEIKGPMAKEVVERFLPLGKIASIVV